MDVQRIREELSTLGFDLCHPIHTSWYNGLIRDEGLVADGTLRELPEPAAALDARPPGCNALLIGNTRRAWPVFLRWLAARAGDPAGGGAPGGIPGPFDAFVEESIPRALRGCMGHPALESCELFGSDGGRRRADRGPDRADGGGAPGGGRRRPGDGGSSFLVSMQRVATTTGEYWQDDEATKLCVHPEYGTWTAFRTVVVFEMAGARCPILPPPPPPCPCPVSEEEIKMAKTVFDYALTISSSEDGYGATLNKSWEELCDYLHGTVCSGSKWEEVPDAMKPWIQLRDCIIVGRADWKYTQAQLLYHYTKDSEILRSELKRINS